MRQLRLFGGFGLAELDLDVELQTQVGDLRRIDVEVGFTVVEVKDLRVAGVVAAAEKQLAGYLRARTGQTGQRYISGCLPMARSGWVTSCAVRRWSSPPGRAGQREERRAAAAGLAGGGPDDPAGGAADPEEAWLGS